MNSNLSHTRPAKRHYILPWIICILAAIFYGYDFLLRVMPSVMIHPLMSLYGANATQIGLLSAFYYYAYTPLQLPAGMIVDKYHPRTVLSLSCLLCALSALLFATTQNIHVANLSRAMMGAGSAFAFVGTLKLASLWLPEKRFALFAGLASAIGTLGAVLADNVLSLMVRDFGWQKSVYLAGFIGFLLTLLPFVFVKGNPAHKKMEATQGWSAIFSQFVLLSKNRSTWINGLVGAFLFLPISVFASLWGIDFLARRYDIFNTEAASAVSLIFIGIALAAPFAGHLSDLLQNRRLPLFIGNLGVIFLSYLLIYTPYIPLEWAYGLLFLIGVFTSPQILIFAIANDLSPKQATGMATATANFIVTMGAALFQPLIGYMLDYHWSGSKTNLGTPLFSLLDYQFAFSLLMLSLLSSLILLFFLPSHAAKNSRMIH